MPFEEPERPRAVTSMALVASMVSVPVRLMFSRLKDVAVAKFWRRVDDCRRLRLAALRLLFTSTVAPCNVMAPVLWRSLKRSRPAPFVLKVPAMMPLPVRSAAPPLVTLLTFSMPR